MFENIKKLLSVGEKSGIPASQISVFQGGKDCIEAIKLDLGYEAFVEDMYNGKGQNLA